MALGERPNASFVSPKGGSHEEVHAPRLGVGVLIVRSPCSRTLSETLSRAKADQAPATRKRGRITRLERVVRGLAFMGSRSALDQRNKRANIRGLFRPSLIAALQTATPLEMAAKTEQEGSAHVFAAPFLHRDRERAFAGP